MGKALTTAEFVAKAQEKHGQSFDYSWVNYATSHVKVAVLCPTHGPFMLTPNAHLNGQGCPGCRSGRISAALSKTTADFIERAQAQHGATYDYQAVDYRGTKNTVTIICRSHGEFKQYPSNHLKGIGCPKCGVARTSAAKFKDTAWFVQKARERHGETYSYDKSTYTGCDNKLIITCHRHGDFLQRPAGHIRGSGCPDCSGTSSRVVDNSGRVNIRPASRSGWIERQKGRQATLYLIQLSGNGELFYKVGITYQNITKRFRARCPYQIRTIATFKSYDAGLIYDLEKRLHKEFRSLRYAPKQQFGGHTECFIEAAGIIAALPPDTFLLRWAKAQFLSASDPDALAA